MAAKYRIGGLPQNDVVISDTSVSKPHAKLRFLDGAWQIEDLGSSNGVYVNNELVELAKLAHDDRILLGRCEFVFEQT